MEFETIYSLATGKIDGSLSIIRISGERSFSILKDFITSHKKSDKKIKRQILIGNLYKSKKVVDQCVILKYEKPHSYTGENMLEIICHANQFIVSKIFLTLEDKGFRQAKNGEFTKRAFLNNKVNLLEAESINELIKSKNKYVAEKLLENVLKKSSKVMYKLKESLIEILGNIEIMIDYPEYFINNKKETDINEIEKKLLSIKKIVVNSIKEYDYIKLLNINHLIAIVGPPNSGKSTLFNQILGSNRAIVSNIAGTTRDYISEDILINDNASIKIIDTAGIRHTKKVIESKGIVKSYKQIKQADVVLFLYDYSKNFKNYVDTYNEVKKENKNTFLVANKIDKIKNYKETIKKTKNIFYISSLKGEIEPIIKLFNKLFSRKKYSEEEISFFTARHKNIFNTMEKELNKSIKLLKEGEIIEVVSVHIKKVFKCLNLLIGIDLESDMLDNIFNTFCLGK